MSTIWKNGKYQPLIRYVTNKDFKLLSNLVNIINGDSNTKGSFRKTIKDLIGGAPEAYDTLKEIADKLRDNDDLYTAISNTIATKATTAALNEEITRAKTAEASITSDVTEKLAQKADTTALDNYVLTTALNEQVDTLNAAIGTKIDSTTFSQNLGSVYNDLNNKITNNAQTINQNISSVASGLSGQITANKKQIDSNKKSIDSFHGEFTSYQDYTNQQINGLSSEIAKKQEKGNYIPYEIGLSADYYKITDGLEIETSNHISGGDETVVYISGNGIHFKDKSANQIPTANWDFIDINDYALKTELPTVPTKVSQLTNDSEFITKSVYDEKIAALEARIAALEAKHTETDTQIEA